MQQIVRFGGNIEISYEGEIQKVKWIEGQTVKAMAIDVPTSGYNTFTINCIRKWKCVEDPRLVDST